MATCRICGSHDIDENGGVSNPEAPEVFEAYVPSDRTIVERQKGRDTRAYRALMTLVKKNARKEAFPDADWEKVQELMKVVYYIGQDQRKKRYGGWDTPGCNPVADTTMSLEYEDTAQGWWETYAPIWFDEDWMPEGFWDGVERHVKA